MARCIGNSKANASSVQSTMDMVTLKVNVTVIGNQTNVIWNTLFRYCKFLPWLDFLVEAKYVYLEFMSPNLTK